MRVGFNLPGGGEATFHEACDYWPLLVDVVEAAKAWRDAPRFRDVMDAEEALIAALARLEPKT